MAKKHFLYNDLETSEIFMDSKNLPGFERERFEGRLEFPIPSILGSYIYISLSRIKFNNQIFLNRHTNIFSDRHSDNLCC